MLPCSIPIYPGGAVVTPLISLMRQRVMTQIPTSCLMQTAPTSRRATTARMVTQLIAITQFQVHLNNQGKNHRMLRLNRLGAKLKGHSFIELLACIPLHTLPYAWSTLDTDTENVLPFSVGLAILQSLHTRQHTMLKIGKGIYLPIENGCNALHELKLQGCAGQKVVLYH